MLDVLIKIDDTQALIEAMRQRLMIDPRALNQLQDETPWGLLVGLYAHWGERSPDKQPMFLDALQTLADDSASDPALADEFWTLIAHLAPDLDREQRLSFDQRCPFPPWPPHLDDARLGALLSQLRAKSALRMVTAEDWKRYVSEVLVPACVDDAGAAVPAINTAFTRLRQLGECVDQAVLTLLAIACLGSPTYPKGTLAKWLHNELVLRQSDEDAETSQARVIDTAIAVMGQANNATTESGRAQLAEEAVWLLGKLDPRFLTDSRAQPTRWRAAEVSTLIDRLIEVTALQKAASGDMARVARKLALAALAAKTTLSSDNAMSNERTPIRSNREGLPLSRSKTGMTNCAAAAATSQHAPLWATELAIPGSSMGPSEHGDAQRSALPSTDANRTGHSVANGLQRVVSASPKNRATPMPALHA